MSHDENTPTSDPRTLRRRIALVAHDNCKSDLLEWAAFNRQVLARHDLWATGTTGSQLEHALNLPVTKLKSGPLGGDQQIGARIADGEVDFLIFFWDPLEPHPHDPDVKALLRIAVVWNIPVACNRATADFLISSPLLETSYERAVPEYESQPEAPGRREDADEMGTNRTERQRSTASSALGLLRRDPGAG